MNAYIIIGIILSALGSGLLVYGGIVNSKNDIIEIENLVQEGFSTLGGGINNSEENIIYRIETNSEIISERMDSLIAQSLTGNHGVLNHVPIEYLNNLPKIKYKAFIEAHEYWDSGVTSLMQGGNYLLAEKLLEVLSDLAVVGYPDGTFNNLSAKEFYSKKISLMMKSAWDSQAGGGSLYIVLATSQMADFVDSYIVHIVEKVTDEEYFQEWLTKWKRAGELGAKGEDVELEITDEI